MAQQFQTPILPGEPARNDSQLGTPPLNSSYSRAPNAFEVPVRDTSSFKGDTKLTSDNTFAPPVHIQPSSTNALPAKNRKFGAPVELPPNNQMATPSERPDVDSIYKAPIQSLKNNVNNDRRTPQQMLISKFVSSDEASRSGLPTLPARTTPTQKPQRENAIAKLQNQITNFLYTPPIPSQRFNKNSSVKSRSRYSSRNTRPNVSSASRRKPSVQNVPSQMTRVSQTQQEIANAPEVQNAYSDKNSLDSSPSVQNAVQQVVMVEPTQDPFNDEDVALPPSERTVVEESLGGFEQNFKPSDARQQAEGSEPKPDPSTMSQISVLKRTRGADSPTSTNSISIQDSEEFGKFKKPTQDPAIEALPTPNADFDFGSNQRPSAGAFQTCDDFRGELLDGSIKDIALDLSPLPGRNRALYQTESRDWVDRDGNIVATGTMIDLRRGYVIIESALGTEKVPYAKLSDGDWATISQFWQIPELCSAGNQRSESRSWAPQTYAWQASALCHKPLYFENVQLERYGHTHGPLRQPIHSVAHFFVSLITVPYQTGIHPANECQYALGFYRPGDCAPWLKNPIPFSLNGAARQAFVTTGVAVIP